MLKADFEKYLELRRKLDKMVWEIECLENSILRSPSPGERVQVSNVKSFEIAMVKFVDLKVEYSALCKLAIDERLRIEGIIDAITNSRQRELLWYRYIAGMKWNEICERLGCCQAEVHRIFSNALKCYG